MVLRLPEAKTGVHSFHGWSGGGRLGLFGTLGVEVGFGR
jgi:hypothetical protein